MQKNDIQNLQKLFHEESVKMSFFQQVKKPFLVEADETNRQLVLQQEYFERSCKTLEVPIPAYAKFNNQRLFISQIRITDS